MIFLTRIGSRAAWIGFSLFGSPLWAYQQAPQDSAPAPIEEPGELTTASPEELGALLQEFSELTKAGAGDKLAEFLRRLQTLNNPELLEPAKSALLYEASKSDREAAKAKASELGRASASEIEEFVREREADVQAAAARLCANLPGPKTEAVLLKTLRDKSMRSDRPRAYAGVIDALGRLQCEKAHEDVKSEFGQYRNREIMRACTRFFGQIQSKDKDVVRLLCEMLDPPQPAAVDDASNPPASYWASRWEQWSWIRRDVAWSLKEITGQAFQPADGDKPGDSKRALDWLRANGKKHGIR